MTWPQDWQTNVTFLLRWAHLIGGVAWIGLLYWFNLVNVNFQKEVDASIKGKMNPPLLSRTPTDGLGPAEALAGELLETRVSELGGRCAAAAGA